MKKLVDKINLSLLKAKMDMNAFLNDESGDTNFISIAIILVVVIVIAIVFITFSQEMGAALEESIEELKGALGI